MSEIMMISLGGFLGAISRFAISKRMNGKSNAKLPLGTLLINLLGSFLLGLLWGLKIKGNLYSMLGIGFMGAFTTFSTLQLETVEMSNEGSKRNSIQYLAYSYIGGISFAFLGNITGRLF